LGIPVFGEIKSFAVLFDFLLEQSLNNPITLIIDEFQEFYTLNPTVFGEMQKIWDLKYKNTKINLILCGSIYSLMNKIFENSKEPLFGRANEKINLKPFTISTLKEVLEDCYPKYTNTNLLSFYIFTGGLLSMLNYLLTKSILL
jgi:AAA+ ATPase superfamily predicted ATPase